MAKFVETITNIFKIEELKKRIIYTLLLVLVYRLGCYILLPGLDPEALKGGISGTQEGLFRKMQMEGESGRRKMNQITRYLTIAILAIQGPAYITGMIPRNAIAVGWSSFMFNIVSTIILMAGTMFVMWLGERITDRGIGNGISLIIMIGIVARLPYALAAEIGQKVTGSGVGGPLILVVELVIWFLVIIAAIAIVQAVRKVPVQYAKRVIGNKQYGGVRQYLPLKINAAGVMPIIFAQALMMFPMLLGRWDATRGIAAAFSSYTNFWYNLVFAFLVIVFTYFYTAVTVNPTMMAEDMKKNGGFIPGVKPGKQTANYIDTMKKNGGFIPGVKPGKQTANYIDTIMSRITLPGSIALAFIAIMPAFANIFGINNQFASFFGGTSLLITVGVVLDTLQQIESYLLMRHYDGLMKTGRLTGRSGM